ncbi:galactose mutarotase [Catenovulum sp. 2E275]|uniref:aldose epimerase family protein n=1 Tax=Catenovulum sp. 2E275 TaxID=2980497 RepID=UPI0021D37199|nr:aldose epimerase family protein [Catenovulum sp. 2E275]MCU4676505.1 galactose mutarotase [Catenovulum sp. 2E275]
MTLSIKVEEYGISPKGEAVQLFTLTNAQGASASITNFGANLVTLYTPDNKGQFADIVLGYDSLEDYFTNVPYLGATIGRVGNRIGNGQCEIAGKTYTFVQNNGTNHLHGGLEGFDKKVWRAETFKTESSVGIHLDLLSEDGDQGYPGNLQVRTTYELHNDNQLTCEYSATTDKTTILNMTNHSYFNLDMANQTDILSHELQLKSNQVTLLDQNQLPTGEVMNVAGTAFDFTEPKAIGQDIFADDAQLNIGGGYDINYIITDQSSQLRVAAIVTEAKTGRRLTVKTTEPCIQLYTANFLDGSLKGKGRAFEKHSAFCLEPQHVPDAPNKPMFKSIELKPGETYSSKMSFAFDTV